MPDPLASPAARIALPTGGLLQGFPPVPIQPADCSTITNLQSQIAAFLASTACQFAVLRLLKPLIEIINALPNPSPKALQEFAKASAGLQPCLLSPTAASVVPFIRDLLCLQIRSLNCFLRNLQSAATLEDAGAEGALDIQNVIASYQPIIGIMELAGELFQIAGLKLPPAPVLTAGIDAATLSSDQGAVAVYTASLQSVVDALGGC